MVHPAGVEPTTSRFEAERSIQMSYGCVGWFSEIILRSTRLSYAMLCIAGLRGFLLRIISESLIIQVYPKFIHKSTQK